ncbi:MAG: SagB/ThcOx family dehydrogenase [Bacteroidales bacterium]|nr:SagB/ThcOx family dehydrogenase [Bacteroidales bacterium]MCL2133558.1 SagB/ThcOx family dehydrogenase [Bacteroidales bacterium]
MKKIMVLITACLLISSEIYAQDITLPAPQTDGGLPLMQALSQRQTQRAFSSKELDAQTLSNLLWAANGFNRSDKRTAPTAMNRQELEIYVVLPTGAYWHDAKNNILVQKTTEDLRSLPGQQEFVAAAPLNIVIVADTEKQGNKEFCYIDAGYISQNIYLFCASEGLATVVRGMVNREALSKALNLPEKQIIVVAQTVGYPQ